MIGDSLVNPLVVIGMRQENQRLTFLAQNLWDYDPELFKKLDEDNFASFYIEK